MSGGLRNPYLQVLLWTLGVGSALAAIVLTVPWLPQEASTAANPVDTLYEVLAVVSCYVFALVVSIMLVSVVHFRRRHNDLSDGEPIHGNTTLEAVWTAIPALLMVGTAIYSGLVLADSGSRPLGSSSSGRSPTRTWASSRASSTSSRTRRITSSSTPRT